jgi:hypothetical protein
MTKKDKAEASADAAQAKRELKLTTAALKNMEDTAMENLLKTKPEEEHKRRELIALINVCREIPRKLNNYIDTHKINQEGV